MKKIIYTLVYYGGETKLLTRNYTGPYEDVVNDIITKVDRQVVENIVFHLQ